MTTKTKPRTAAGQKTFIACNHTGASQLQAQRCEVEALIVASVMLTVGALALAVMILAGWLK